MKQKKNDGMIVLLKERGFFLGRRKWSKLRKKLLSDAINTLKNDISQAKAYGSVSAYLANKCCVTQVQLNEQMRKYHETCMKSLKNSFYSRYACIYICNCHI